MRPVKRETEHVHEHVIHCKTSLPTFPSLTCFQFQRQTEQLVATVNQLIDQNQFDQAKQALQDLDLHWKYKSVAAEPCADNKIKRGPLEGLQQRQLGWDSRLVQWTNDSAKQEQLKKELKYKLTRAQMLHARKLREQAEDEELNRMEEMLVHNQTPLFQPEQKRSEKVEQSHSPPLPPIITTTLLNRHSDKVEANMKVNMKENMRPEQKQTKHNLVEKEHQNLNRLQASHKQLVETLDTSQTVVEQLARQEEQLHAGHKNLLGVDHSLKESNGLLNKMKKWFRA